MRIGLIGIFLLICTVITSGLFRTGSPIPWTLFCFVAMWMIYETDWIFFIPIILFISGFSTLFGGLPLLASSFGFLLGGFASKGMLRFWFKTRDPFGDAAALLAGMTTLFLFWAGYFFVQGGISGSFYASPYIFLGIAFSTSCLLSACFFLFLNKRMLRNI